MMSPPWTLPSRLASVAEAMMPRLTRLYDVGRGSKVGASAGAEGGVGWASLMPGTVASGLMADRPQGSGMPEKGTPEYDWLYGGSSQSPPR